MARVKSYQDILELAIAREVEAHYFYLAMAGKVQSATIGKIFEELANEELEHKAKLELEVMKTGKTISTELPESRPESDYIISNSQSKFDMDYKDILLLGIEKEKAAFRTYVNMVSEAHDQDSREMLMDLAEEEVRHMLRFENEYEKLINDT